MKLTTKRLILRPLKDSDAQSICENVNDPDVSKWLAVVAHPYKIKDAKSWIKANKKDWKKRVKGEYSFGIELKSEKRIIGSFGIHGVDKFRGKATLGYWIGKRYWRQGYGGEAFKAVADFAFKKLKLRRLEAGVFPGNPSSGKLLEKFGAKLEGMKRKSHKCKADGEIKDEFIYGLLKEEYTG